MSRLPGLQSVRLQASSPYKFGHLRKPYRRDKLRAGAEKQQLAEQIKEASLALASAGEEARRQLSSYTDRRAESVDAKEAALWARQETLWQRELKRWEEERLWWDKRETQLLQKIHELHAALSQLVGSSTIVQTSSADGAEPVAQLATVQRSRSEEPQSAAQASSVGSRAESSQPTKSVLDEAMRFMPSDDASFTPPRADSFPPLGVDADDDEVQRVRSSLHTAFSEASLGDVLSPSYDAALLSGRGPDIVLDEQPQQQTYAAPSVQRPASSPPNLSLGADDIFWMDQLHKGLVEASIFPGEEEMEDWSFGEQTRSAVETFQAFAGLPETGVVDIGTWRALLGSTLDGLRAPEEPADTSPAAFDDRSVATNGAATPAMDPEVLRVRALRQDSELENRRRTTYTERQPAKAGTPVIPEAWPALREGDGGRDVHYLHVALEQRGFIADEEDQRWWFFGSSTNDCVLTFQACSGLAETGCAERETWLALLGVDAAPSSLVSLTNDYEDDMSDDSEAIWLLGEQRWERRRKQDS